VRRFTGTGGLIWNNTTTGKKWATILQTSMIGALFGTNTKKYQSWELLVVIHAQSRALKSTKSRPKPKDMKGLFHHGQKQSSSKTHPQPRRYRIDDETTL
jgi:hypothetical protein